MKIVGRAADKVAMLHDEVIQWAGPVREIDANGDAHAAQLISGSADGPIETLRWSGNHSDFTTIRTISKKTHVASKGSRKLK